MQHRSLLPHPPKCFRHLNIPLPMRRRRRLQSCVRRDAIERGGSRYEQLGTGEGKRRRWDIRRTMIGMYGRHDDGDALCREVGCGRGWREVDMQILFVHLGVGAFDFFHGFLGGCRDLEKMQTGEYDGGHYWEL